MRVIGRVVRLWWEGRGGKLAPAGSAVPAPQFRAEMPEIERGVCGVILGQHRADRVAEKMHIYDVPPCISSGAAPRQFEQTLARADIKPFGHTLPRQPPVRA